MLFAEAVKKSANRGTLGHAVFQQIHTLTKIIAARQSTHIPADVLASAQHAGKLTVQAVVVFQVFEQPALDLHNQWLRQVFTSTSR